MKKTILYYLVIFSFSTILKSQECQDITLVQNPAQCPEIYAPVCGCDGNTYINACYAQQTGGVTSFTEGPCLPVCSDTEMIDPDAVCPGIFLPVCACNGQTFSNACEATNYGGILQFVEGECPPGCRNEALVDSGFVCQDVYQPVCGCDSITYYNNCYATYYGGVPVYSDGPCPLTYCKDFSTIDSSFDCLLVVEPVCGCDSITYQNSCEAEKYNGVRNWTPGPCLTGLNKKSKVSFSIGPNPANDYLRIQLDGVQRPVRYLINDCMANPIKSAFIHDHTSFVNLNDVSPGIYYMVVFLDEPLVKKLIVVK